jgi:outer membrane protein OmpA-like peptidoglycan-associated protein
MQRTAGNRAVGAVLARRALQRSVVDDAGAFLGAIGEAIGEGARTVSDTLASAPKKAATLAELAGYPLCTTAAPKPDLATWLDNEGLEVLRHGEGELLSRSHVPSGGDRGATSLVKQALQAWGCEKLGRDLLPKHGTGGPFGPETAKAVKQLQLFSWLDVDGVIGPATMAALDGYLGVRPSSRVPTAIGGTAEKGESTWSRFEVPAGRIYFVTDGAALDADDDAVLEDMADSFRTRALEIKLNVVGYADKREHTTYNLELANRRAAAVAQRLTELLDEREVIFAPIGHKAKGEIERPQFGETAEELKPFRRVDIHIVDFEPWTPATCEATEPATEWIVRHRNMQGLGFGSFGQVEIETANPDSRGKRWRQTFKFAGLGPSLAPKFFPSVSDESTSKPFTTTVPLVLDQFEGSAEFGSAGAAGFGTGVSVDVLEIDGIKHHGADIVTVEWAGATGGVTLGAGVSVAGWLTPFRECIEVTES